MTFTGPILVLTSGRFGTRTMTNSRVAAGHDAIPLHAIGPATDNLVSMHTDTDVDIVDKVDRSLIAEMHIRRAIC